ncbi:hypothetical protein DH2020_011675 [Rehmannia glutinosa]|uniref:Uncharacterized protein n=1 Tax=Rehmannia glutinosa TaxID=99300 RepID=A0ABR0XE75_REHGL
MAAWTAAARQAANLARLSAHRSAATSQASILVQRRGLAGGGVCDCVSYWLGLAHFRRLQALLRGQEGQQGRESWRRGTLAWALPVHPE